MRGWLNEANGCSTKRRYSLAPGFADAAAILARGVGTSTTELNAAILEMRNILQLDA
jgi:hypothetical protein